MSDVKAREDITTARINPEHEMRITPSWPDVYSAHPHPKLHPSEDEPAHTCEHNTLLLFLHVSFDSNLGMLHTLLLLSMFISVSC